MKIKEKISDRDPVEPIHELDIITFKKTDRSRWAVKGHVGTVVDMLNVETFGYTIECYNGEISEFQRHEFRPATQLDIERFENMYAKKAARQEKRKAEDMAWKKAPEMPDLGEDAFRLWK